MKKKVILMVLCSLALVGCSATRTAGVEDDRFPTTEGSSTPKTDDNLVRADENLSETTAIKVHYARNDGNYTNWGIWTWQYQPTSTDGKMLMFTESDGVYGNYTTIDLVNDSRYKGATTIGFICKTHTGSSDTTWTPGKTDISSDRFIEVPEKAPEGVYEVYLYEGVEEVMTSLEEALKDKIVSSDFTDKTTIVTSLILSAEVSSITEGMFHIYEDGIEQELASFSYKDKKVTVRLSKEADITKTYTVKVDFPSGALQMDVGISCFYDDQSFIDNYTYYGDDLGVTFNSDHSTTTFKLWSPLSSKVILNLYDSGTTPEYEAEASKLEEYEFVQTYPTRKMEMKKCGQGVWSITVPANLHGRYYTYTITNGATTSEVVDPYARSCGIDGKRGMVVDFDKINEELNWDEVVRPDRIEDATDASIYEVHVRDVTVDETSGVEASKRGTYLGLAEKDTSYTSNGKTVSTGLSSIKELGVTHIQLQPVYDYHSVDEATKLKYNWGYDPENYNCLEGSYSTNPWDGLTRIKEFKTMMKSISEEGLLVNMDVVFNHTFGSGDTNFEKIIPGYYHRMNSDGTFSDGSGCGNEMASERAMYRKFVVDSCKFWMSEYNIAGFRFDLMALLDTTTMETVYTECAKIYDKVMVYGEPWSGGTSTDTYIQSNKTTIQGIKGVGAFNDGFRNAVRGDNSLSAGWIQNSSASTDSIVQGIWGQFSESLTNPLKTVNYVSCHDNYTLFDQIDRTVGTTASATRKVDQAEQAQAMVFMSQGISFIHGGEEFLRTKSAGTDQQIHNSYNAGDAVNKFDYARKAQYADVYEFMKKIIGIRNEFKGFRLPSYDEISKALKVTSQTSLIDYSITYEGSTYRVVSNSGSASTIADLSGYTLLASNQNRTSGSNSIAQNEICVFRK